MQPSIARRDKLVVAHADRKAQRMLHRLVGATLCKVEVVSDARALVDEVDPDTIAIVDVELARQVPELHTRPARAWIAVPGEAPADQGAVAALLDAGWIHVIAQAMPLLAEELLATVQKVLRGDVFGLEKYMTWGAEVRTYVLDDARDRDAAVAALANDVIDAGLPGRIGSLVSVVADELIANALYVAPIDAGGGRFRTHDAREVGRALVGRDVVTVRWASDGRYVAIEVRDRWGSIDGPSIAPRLAAAARQTAVGEGGMGLPLAYACANQFVINCAHQNLTEIIALLDCRYKPTELARSASFHTFTGTAPPT